MSEQRGLAISPRWLLGIYAVVPVLLLCAVIDRLWFGGALRHGVLRDQGDVAFYHLVAGTPHILASSVILFSNGEYRRAFGRPVLRFTVGTIALLVLGGLFVSHVVLFALVGILTVTHVIRQQVGIGRALGHVQGRLYGAWGWSAVAVGAITYNSLYLSADMGETMTHGVAIAVPVLVAIFVVLTLACHRRIAPGPGRSYLWANAAMVLVSLALVAEGYLLLGSLGPRLVHDATAFTFYSVHDFNRHRPVARSALYRWLPVSGRGLLWASPILAVLLTLTVPAGGDRAFNWVASNTLGFTVPRAVSFYVMVYFALLHYYTEAITWRRGSPYRPYVPMG